MNALAYLPDRYHDTPSGTDKQALIKNLKTYKGIIKRAIRLLGPGVVIKRYTNIYEPDSFHSIYRGNECNCPKCLS